MFSRRTLHLFQTQAFAGSKNVEYDSLLRPLTSASGRPPHHFLDASSPFSTVATTSLMAKTRTVEKIHKNAETFSLSLL